MYWKYVSRNNPRETRLEAALKLSPVGRFTRNKKRDARAGFFLPFSLTSPSSLPKLPSNSNATGNLWCKGRKRNRVHFLFFFSYKHLGGAAHLIAFGMTQRFGALFYASYVKIGRFLVTELTRINAGPNLNRGMRSSF